VLFTTTPPTDLALVSYLDLSTKAWFICPSNSVLSNATGCNPLAEPYYFRHSGRFAKETSAAFTKDHTGTRNPFRYNGTNSAAGAAPTAVRWTNPPAATATASLAGRTHPAIVPEAAQNVVRGDDGLVRLRRRKGAWCRLVGHAIWGRRRPAEVNRRGGSKVPDFRSARRRAPGESLTSICSSSRQTPIQVPRVPLAPAHVRTMGSATKAL